jgi:hypothetical protein
MAQKSSERSIALTDYIDPEWFIEVQGSNPLYSFLVKQEHYQTALDALTAINHVSAWKHDEVPVRLHYGSNCRVLDFIALADSSWSLTWKPIHSEFSGGTHGYDNKNSDMYAIFFAIGPAFKSGYIHPGFHNIDIYPLIAEILDLVPAEVDGSLEGVSTLLITK